MFQDKTLERPVVLEVEVLLMQDYQEQEILLLQLPHKDLMVLMEPDHLEVEVVEQLQWDLVVDHMVLDLVVEQVQLLAYLQVWLQNQKVEKEQEVQLPL